MSSKKILYSNYQVPILFLVFNRPDTTKRVFEMIRKVRPKKLYVAADGARYKKNEEMAVSKVREIATNVDWSCEVKTMFRNKNLGCKEAVSQAITWFFKNEEFGIILEDDCLPHIDFFYFCRNLLEVYSKNEKVFAITGNNFQDGKWYGDSSYYFSKFPHCWGWATWRRSWKHYRGNIPFWKDWSKSKAWINFTPNKVERNYWTKIFNLVEKQKFDSWAYPWLCSVWYKNGLTATPNVNLVTNIGFGERGTHTKSKNDKFSNMQVKSIGELKHIKNIERNEKADAWTFNFHYGGKNLYFPFNFINFLFRLKNFIIKMLINFLNYK